MYVQPTHLTEYYLVKTMFTRRWGGCYSSTHPPPSLPRIVCIQYPHYTASVLLDRYIPIISAEQNIRLISRQTRSIELQRRRWVPGILFLLLSELASSLELCLKATQQCSMLSSESFYVCLTPISCAE